MGKGASYERAVCKQLSEWWSPGRSDIFWRSSQSGGRATQRAKSGQTTFGSWGDIAAVDPIGLPLLKLVTIELKRGYDRNTPWDLFDSAPTTAQRPFEQALCQARRCAQMAGSVGWMLVCRRDRRVPIAYFSMPVVQLLKDMGVWRKPCVKFDLPVNEERKGVQIRFQFVALPLETFLARVKPEQILSCLQKL